MNGEYTLVENLKLKPARPIRRRRKAVPPLNATDRDKAPGLNNTQAGNKLQQSNQGNQLTSNKQQQSRNSKSRRRRRSHRRGRGRGQEHQNNASQNDSLDAMSNQPQAANASSHMIDSKDTFEEDKDDKGRHLVSLKEEPLAPNSKVSSFLSSPVGTKRNEDGFSSGLSVSAKDEGLECLLDLVEKSSSKFHLNGREEGNVIPGKDREWWGVFQGRHCDDEGNYHQTLLGTETNEQLARCFGTVTKVIWSGTVGRNAFLKWLFIVLNVVAEIWQAVITEEEAQGKMGRQNYLKLSISTSSFCLIMSLVEAFHQGRSSGVVWQRRGLCWWFYYPGQQGQLFGGFLLYFGIICSMFQCFVNLIADLTNKDFIKFDYVPLLLSVFHLVSATISSREKTGLLATVNCKTHGFNATEAKIVDGNNSWVFECPKCQEDIP